MKTVHLIKCLCLFLVVSFTAFKSQAAAPTCAESNGNSYCSYVGKVKKIYVNSNNLILMYFDTSVDITIPQSYGYNISYAYASAILIDDNPEFAKLFYSTALTAQATGRTVTIQMRGVQNGYLKADRIWLYE